MKSLVASARSPSWLVALTGMCKHPAQLRVSRATGWEAFPTKRLVLCIGQSRDPETCPLRLPAGGSRSHPCTGTAAACRETAHPRLPRRGVSPHHLLSAFQGNDQVRFELTCYALCPNIKVRDPKLSPESPPPGSWLLLSLVGNFVLTLLRAAVPHVNKLPAAPSGVLAFEGAVMILN